MQKGPLVAVKLPGMLIAFRQAEPTGGSAGNRHGSFRLQRCATWRRCCRRGAPQATRIGREFTGAEGFPNAYLMAPDDVRIELQEDKTSPVKAVGLSPALSPRRLREAARLVRRDVLDGAAQARNDCHDRRCAGHEPLVRDLRDAHRRDEGRAIDHIGFEVTNLEAFCKKLEARGVKFDVPFRNVPAIGLNIAYITDPHGTYIELTEGCDKYA